MLRMGFSRQQRDFHIRDIRARQHARMAPLLQMGENQPLPVPVQHILTAAAFKCQAAARRSRLQQKMYLRVMPQGLEMSHAFHGVRNRFLIYNTSRPEIHREAKPLLHQAFQDLQLHLAHDPHMNLREFLPPDHMKLRQLLLQKPQLGEHLVDIAALRRQKLVGQHRLHLRNRAVRLEAQPLSGPRPGKASHRADRSGRSFIQRLKASPGIEPQLIRLLLPGLPVCLSCQNLPGLQASSRHLEKA